MDPVASPLHDALLRAQARIEANELRLARYPSGEGDQLVVPAGDHLLVIDPRNPCVRAVPRKAHERFVGWTRVARLGMNLIALGWIAILLAAPVGLPLLPGLLTAAVGLLFFAVPLGVCWRCPAEPFVVCPAHPLADRAASALDAASQRTADRPPPAFAWELPRASAALSR